jgi:UPF0755 protein
MKLLLIFIFFIVRIDAIPITIPPGSNARWVSEHLKQKKIINSSRLFYLYLRTNNLSTQLHSGDFDIPQDAPYKEISDILIGKKQHYVSVTIPEGYTMQEIANTLVDKKIIKDAATFLNHVSNQPPSKINHRLANTTLSSFEGILFPDTYYFTKHSSNTMVYNAFIKRFNQVFIHEYESKKNPTLSFYDTLILASIIEKEAGTIREMATISGVFHNRLRKKMYLASCPTVGYAMGQPRKKSLTYKDLAYDSPYNTYKNKGLPPTPIASPGKLAFQAALNPAKTPYLYFVAKNDGSGEHVFSLTLKDHLRNQQKILAQTK